MYILYSILSKFWIIFWVCDINKCFIVNSGDFVIWDVFENVKLFLFTNVLVYCLFILRIIVKVNFKIIIDN